MKKVLVLLSMFSAVNSSAAEIKGGRFNAKKTAIELDVAYGGGCQKHTFSLQIGSCLESQPVQCREVKLIENANGDACRAYLHETIVLPLNEFGLNNSYYTGASLTINGDNKTKVTVRLPR